MNPRMIALVMALATSNAFAAGPKAAPCLFAADTKECLVDVAIAALAMEKSPESRVDGTASLLSSLAKAGVRRDDLFSAAKDDETAPIYSRWSLAVARRTYALRQGTDTSTLESPQRIRALAELLLGRRDGLERLGLVWTACEAREGETPDAIAKWEGTVDHLCRIDALDLDALEKDLPGFSALGATVVNAYNRDEAALSHSIATSLGVLSEYEMSLDRKMPTTEREFIHGMLATGFLVNATALAISGHGAESAKAIETSLGHLAKTQTLGKSSEFQSAFAHASWIYAKAGMRDEALAALRLHLTRIDGKGVSGGDRASAIGISIEALRALEVVR